MDERELIYDWNRAGPAFDWSRARVDLNDETLRDGLQSPSVRDPSLEVKKRLLHLRSEEHTSELQSRLHLVCRLLLEKKKRHKQRERSDITRDKDDHSDVYPT